MKKYFIFLLITGIIILFYNIIFKIPKNYTVSYFYDQYSIVENFSKSDKLYSFEISYNDNKFDFVSNRKYSSKRKLINFIDVNEKDNDICMLVRVDNVDLPVVCKDKDGYKTESLSLNEKITAEKVGTYNNVDFFTDKSSYYIWNKKGFKNIKTGKEFKLFNKEVYNINLIYSNNKYVLVPDYDSSRSFNKFYIFDNEKQKVIEWKLKVDISFDSYFLGEYDDYIYLFDTKNKVEYKLNIKKKKISIVSNKDGGITYDNGFKDLTIAKMVYNIYKFKFNDFVNYKLDDKTLYYNVYNSDLNVKVFDGDVKDLVKVDGNTVYFVSGDSLYSYTYGEKVVLLLKYFAWNFSFDNKIFIFD